MPRGGGRSGGGGGCRRGGGGFRSSAVNRRVASASLPPAAQSSWRNYLYYRFCTLRLTFDKSDAAKNALAAATGGLVAGHALHDYLATHQNKPPATSAEAELLQSSVAAENDVCISSLATFARCAKVDLEPESGCAWAWQHVQKCQRDFEHLERPRF